MKTEAKNVTEKNSNTNKFQPTSKKLLIVLTNYFIGLYNFYRKKATLIFKKMISPNLATTVLVTNEPLEIFILISGPTHIRQKNKEKN